MAILNIIILLSSVICASHQTEDCVEFRQKLQALSEAVQTMCGSSTPSNTTATPPSVEQQCDRGPAVNWTSVPLTRIGSPDMHGSGTLAYDIPSVIPNSAKELLVYVSAQVGSSGPRADTQDIKLYTQQDTHQYEKYIFIVTYTQEAYNTNSDNLWFPMTTERKFFVELPSAHTGWLFLFIYAIGYR